MGKFELGLHLKGSAKDRRKQYRRLVRLNPECDIRLESNKTIRKKINGVWVSVKEANSVRTQVFIKGYTINE